MSTCQCCGIEYEGRGGIFCSRACANKQRRIDERNMRETKTVWSCGGGVQSTAIAALIYNGKLPKPDYAVMVDTGFEKQCVIDYVLTVTKPKLAEIGVTLNIIKTTDYTDQSLISDDGYCIIPVYRVKDGTTQKLRTCCNDKWKVNVIRKWLQSKGVEQYESWIGISTDESHRQRKPHKAYYTLRYPLIELGMNRDDCINYICKVTGWGEPPRSSCYICGQQDDGEWWRMAMTQPNDFKKAVEVEKELQKIDPNIFLNRKCKPLNELFKL